MDSRKTALGLKFFQDAVGKGNEDRCLPNGFILSQKGHMIAHVT
jgi:hypothetical protein